MISEDRLELGPRFAALAAAKNRYAETSGDSNPYNAYRTDAEVKEIANGLLEVLSDILGNLIHTPTIRHQICANPSLLDRDDIISIATTGDAEALRNGKTGGLLDAILTVEPDRSPGEIITYCKTRARGAVVDAYRKRQGRRAGGGGVGFAVPLSSFAHHDDEGGGFEPVDESSTFGQANAEHEVLHGLMAALQKLPRHDRERAAAFMHDLSEYGDIDAVIAARDKHNLTSGATGDDAKLRRSLIALKSAYLGLDDAMLPEVLVKARQHVMAQRNDWGRFSDAAFAYAKLVGLTLSEIGELVGISESRISQIKTNHNITNEILNALGLTVERQKIVAPAKGEQGVLSFYMDTSQASEMTGMKRGSVIARAHRINPIDNYTPEGILPDKNYSGPTVKGSALAGKALSSDHWILSAPMVAAWAQAATKEKDLKAAGWQPLVEAARDIGISDDALHQRVYKLREGENYNPDGTACSGDKGLKPEEVAWQNPYNQSMVLLRPEYIEGQKQAELKAKELEEDGWKTIVAAKDVIGISRNRLDKRLLLFSDDDLCQANGRPAADGAAVSYRGSELRWHHPYGQPPVLINPLYVEAMRQDEEKLRAVQADSKYMGTAQAREKLGWEKRRLQYQMAKIQPDTPYLLDGTEPGPGNRRKVVMGSEVIFRHPHNDKEVWLRREFVDRLQKEARNTRSDKGSVKAVAQGGSIEDIGEVTELSPEDAAALHKRTEKRGRR